MKFTKTAYERVVERSKLRQAIMGEGKFDPTWSLKL
jgi:hypothetical protein